MGKYGKTFWGGLWLNALSKIDYSNRLPRGASYANKGAVTAIEIKNGNIKTQVEGSRPTPYKVTVKVPAFSKSEQEHLSGHISNNPVYMAQLLNRKLPPQLLEIAEKQSIHIFPEKWDDLEMKCSCPDWAVPCKHLAASIYMIANEIDRDPFLVFNLKELNLAKLLKGQNIDIDEIKKERIFDLRDTLTPVKPSYQAPEKIDFNFISLTSIPDLNHIIPFLPEAQPAFASANMHLIMEKGFARISRAAKKELNRNFEPVPEIAEPLNSAAKAVLVFNRRSVTLFDTISAETPYAELSLDEVVQHILSLSDDQLQLLCHDLQLLQKSYLLSLHLMQQGAIVPQLAFVEKSQYFIRWVPATNSLPVKHLVEYFSKLFSPDYHLYATTPKNIYFTHEERFTALFLAFTHELIPDFSRASSMPYSFSDSADFWYSFLFSGETWDFDNLLTESIPNAIQLWANIFKVHANEVTPLLVAGEMEEMKFMIDAMVSVPGEETVLLWEYMEEQDDPQQRLKVMKDFSFLSNYLPGFEEYLSLKNDQCLVYNANEFVTILQQSFPTLEMLGVKILLPKSLKQVLKPKPAVKISTKNQSGNSTLRLDHLLDFKWQIAVGDESLNTDDFMKLVKNASGLVKLRENYVYIDQSDIDRLQKFLQKPPNLNSHELLRAAISGEWQGAPVEISDELRKKIEDLRAIDEVPLPASIQAQLRQYQSRGFSWLYKNLQLGFGSLLADDMGLGKTLQVITLLLKLKEEGELKNYPALIVVPTGLLTNWQNEVKKFAPELTVEVYHGSKRALPDSAYDILVTTYGLLRNDQDVFKKTNWYCCVIDEAQNIKNPGTAQTKAVKSIKAGLYIAMSGTPVENRLSEFWSIMDFTNRGYLGSLKKFEEEIARPISRDLDKGKLEMFKKITSPFLLRREKTDKSIISDLPDKIEMDAFCNLSSEQAALYESVVNDTMQQIQESEGIARRGLVLKLITSLKQIGNHPSLFLHKQDADHKVSGKSKLLVDLLSSIHETGEKTLVFTQYTGMAELLMPIIAEATGHKPLYLHGGMSRPQRDEAVKLFQENPYHRVFVLSLKAAGVGLNLTAANHVIHYDLWWNPAVENQATDRAFRIGQNKNVMVHRLINKNTFEEKIDNMIKSKKHLADMSVAKGESWIGDLNNDELGQLVKLSEG